MHTEITDKRISTKVTTETSILSSQTSQYQGRLRVGGERVKGWKVPPICKYIYKTFFFTAKILILISIEANPLLGKIVAPLKF